MGGVFFAWVGYVGFSQTSLPTLRSIKKAHPLNSCVPLFFRGKYESDKNQFVRRP